MWNLTKVIIQKNLKTETDSKILKPNSWLPKRKRGAGGIN